MLGQRIWFGYAGLLTGVAALSLAATMAFAAEVPAMMDAIVQQGAGGPDVLTLQHVPVPKPQAGQVLVQVYAAGINPVEWRARQGVRRQDQGPPPGKEAPAAPAGTPPPDPSQPIIPGDEMAGMIAAVGPGVTHWHVGDAVYGKGVRLGGYAQYDVADSDGIAPKPKRLTFAAAGGIPEAGITALRAVDQTALTSGQTMVIVGAAGGVGSAAVQIAKARGLKVIAIASSLHNAYLAGLGADEIVNYDKGNPADKIKNADGVINLVDGPAAATLAYVKHGGIIILPAGVIPREQCATVSVTCDGMDRSITTSTADSLAQITRLADAGKFNMKVEKAFALAEAGQAQEMDRAGHAEGKVVVTTTAAADQH